MSLSSSSDELDVFKVSFGQFKGFKSNTSTMLTSHPAKLELFGLLSHKNATEKFVDLPG